jgi:protein-S-isoprenylcysteine O-methyltransferase Ste14
MNIHQLFLIILPSIWGAFEGWLILRDRLRGKGGVARDRGSLFFNFIAIFVGLVGGAGVSRLTGFRFPGGWSDAIFWTGIGVATLGFGLRVWAVVILGASFRTTVETHEGQKVVSRGPYSLIRHPSYAGLIVLCAGFGLAVQNWLSLALAAILPLAALLYRIHVEEPVLRASLGSEYEAYRQRTKKLIPWIW